ncbi:MAG: hypothetical protein AAGJ37_14330 [Pseudomonadota bacterium]
MTRLLSYAIVLIFLTHQTFGLLMNHARLAHINMTIGDDIELICTGNDMRWISVSLSMQTNEFVFVDAPNDIQQIDANALCPDIDARDDDSFKITSYTNIIASWSAYQAVAFAAIQAKLLVHKYALSAPRAPPHNSLI